MAWPILTLFFIILILVLKKGKSAVTSGLVGEATLTVLPQVLPLHTFILTVTFMLVKIKLKLKITEN